MAARVARVVLADDHAELLRQVRELLRSEFAILDEVSDGSMLIQSARQWKPDVVISDFQMSPVSGIDACRQILQDGSCRAAIILSMYNDRQLVTAALQAGILGYVLKVDAGEELIPAVRRVLNGSVYLSRGVRRKWLE